MHVYVCVELSYLNGFKLVPGFMTQCANWERWNLLASDPFCKCPSRSQTARASYPRCSRLLVLSEYQNIDILRASLAFPFFSLESAFIMLFSQKFQKNIKRASITNVRRVLTFWRITIDNKVEIGSGRPTHVGLHTCFIASKTSRTVPRTKCLSIGDIFLNSWWSQNKHL